MGARHLECFQWGTTYYADKEAGWLVTKMRYEAENLKLSVGYDIKSKLLAVREAEKRINVAEKPWSRPPRPTMWPWPATRNRWAPTLTYWTHRPSSPAQAALTGAKADYLTALSQLYVAMGEFPTGPYEALTRMPGAPKHKRKRNEESYLTITPLGGLGEIGLNCQLWETAGGVVMVDCGLMFPDDAHLGVDVVIPILAQSAP